MNPSTNRDELSKQGLLAAFQLFCICSKTSRAAPKMIF
jgi:hypothetical protein